MNNIGRWRWLIICGFPILAGAGLVMSGLVTPRFEGETALFYTGDPSQVDGELALFRSHPLSGIQLAKARGDARRLSLQADGKWPADVATMLKNAAQSYIARSLVKQKNDLADIARGYQVQSASLQSRMESLAQQQKTIRSGPRRNTPRAQLAAKIEELKARRRLLIERYPTHTDIQILAKQIQELSRRLNGQLGPAVGKVFDLDRQMNEAKVRRDYFARAAQAVEQKKQTLKPAWETRTPIETHWLPSRIDNWPWAAGAIAGSFAIAFILFRKRAPKAVPDQAVDMMTTEATEVPPVAESVELEVVPPELPSDPLVEKSSALYMKWVELARLLYTPALEPPQGVLDQVAPLLQESTDFLPEGHEVLAKYLAHSVTPGDLPSHVARTVLMTLTGAEEAKVSPEHRLAMGLAALFHDLAVVPRPTSAQDEVGSEVGRLSAAVLPRIPGLPDALLAMVDDILVGMDEYKMDTWQNAATGKSLEPLSKVLREIDRFEKLMQKQRARLDRRIANQ